MITLIRAAWQDKLRVPMFVGLSTDGYPSSDDPAVINGARINHMDNGKIYEYSIDDDTWYKVPQSGGGGGVDYAWLNQPEGYYIGEKEQSTGTNWFLLFLKQKEFRDLVLERVNDMVDHMDDIMGGPYSNENWYRWRRTLAVTPPVLHDG